MKNKLVLLSLDWTRPKDPPLSLGHASIFANLQHNKINVLAKSWAVNSQHFSPHAVLDFIMKHAEPNTDIALGAFVWNESVIQNILPNLKKNHFTGRIILGGPQVSYTKSGLEKYYPQADVFIRGYAENALLKLMQTTEKMPSIMGVHYAGMPDLGLSASADLGTLPSPFLTNMIPPQPFIRWETQRGCPFRCSFCQHRESDITMKKRHLALERVMEEVEWMSKNKIIQDVAVLDPIFNSGPNYLAVLDKFIETKFTGKLSLQCRIEMLKPEFLDRIVDLNKTGRVVLEFGLQTIHPEEQRVIDRISNMKLIEKMLLAVKERNIENEVSLIFGLPKQTVKSFKESIEFCKRHSFSKIHAFPLMLLRGTELYYQKDNLNLVESSEIASPLIDRIQTDIPHVVSSPSFTYEEWKEMANIAASLEQDHIEKSAQSSSVMSQTPDITFWSRRPKNSVDKQNNIEEHHSGNGLTC